MERKRAAASTAVDAALHVKKRPTNDSATVIVTPERAKKTRLHEGGDPNPTEDGHGPGKREPEADEQVSEEAEKEQDSVGDNDGDNEDGDAPAVVVDSNKPPETAINVLVTADSVLGFTKHPHATNREIMTQHIDFVNWAKSKKEKGSVYGRLKDFLEWVESPEGKGFEKFTFGQHKGQTFADVALHDPEYHVRYIHVLRKKGESPSDELAAYISWFEKTRGTSSALNRKFTFGQHKGQTFAEVALHDPEYHVRYIHVLGNKGESPSGELAAYISWFEKTRGTSSALNRTPTRISNTSTSINDGNERFTFGLHKGQTFQEVAAKDPSYHLRYMAMNTSLHPEMAMYIGYFDECGDQQAAHEGEMDAIAYHAGIYRPCCYSAQDD